MMYVIRKLSLETSELLFVPTNSQRAFSGRFFTGECKRLVSARTPEALQRGRSLAAPEIAFIGRSNVGKSSLINALVGGNQHQVATTSSKPGHTRSLNFYLIKDKLTFVDMPGYGHGVRSYFAGLVDSYLRSSKWLRSCCLLIDSVAGFKDKDWDMVQGLDEYRIPYQVVLTKVDKLRASQLNQMMSTLPATLEAETRLCFPQVFPVSTFESRRIQDLRCYLLSVAGLLK
jgi:GTP-binding protein